MTAIFKAAAGAAMLAAAGATAQAQAQAKPEAQTETLRFELQFGGVLAGHMNLSIDRDGPRYEALAQGRPADWLSALFSARLSARGAGEAGGDALRPERFETRVRFGDDDQRVAVRWGAGGAPEQVEADPPFRPKPWAIDPADQTGAADPLGAAVRWISARAPEALCDETLDLFDGRRRSRVTLGAPVAAENGAGWRCSGDWRRVAGWKPEAMQADPTPIRVAFSAGADGLARLSRLEVVTRWGTGVARRLPAE
ncbi:MAG: DUF3108 domain-containing protein [Pseudomonadota bacterium]